jgi:4-hydroxybenzoate polyprenyltransferase
VVGGVTSGTRPNGLAQAAAAFRAVDWWRYKLTPPLAILWASMLQGGVPFLAHCREALVLVVAVAACAAYVSLINDLFDREEDARSGKPNRSAGLSRASVTLLLATVAVPGLFFLWTWRAQPAAALAYAGSWLIFTFYSVPPVRLKVRGLAGVFADAVGSTLLPCLLAAFIAANAGGRFDLQWIATVALWTLAWGLRGILWHQALDHAADSRSGVRTFAQRRGKRVARRLSHRTILPAELGALTALLWQFGSVIPVVALLLYLGLVAARRRLWQDPRPVLLLDEYYDGLLPGALLLASAIAQPWDLVLLVPLFILFGGRPRAIAQGLWRLAQTGWYRGRARLGSLRRRLQEDAAG